MKSVTSRITSFARRRGSCTRSSEKTELHLHFGGDLDVVGGEDSHLAVQGPTPPILVFAFGHGNDVTLAKLQLSCLLAVKIVGGPDCEGLQDKADG